MEGYFSNIINRIEAPLISNLGQVQPTSVSTVVEPSNSIEDPFETIQEDNLASEPIEVTEKEQSNHSFSDLLNSLSKQPPQSILPSSPPPNELPVEKVKEIVPVIDVNKNVLDTKSYKDSQSKINQQFPKKEKVELSNTKKNRIRPEILTPSNLKENLAHTQEIFDKSNLIQKKEKETIQVLEKQIQLQDKRKPPKVEEIVTILPKIKQAEQTTNSSRPQNQDKKLVIGNLNVEVIIPSAQKNKPQPQSKRPRKRPFNRFSISSGNLGNKSIFGLGQL